MKYYLELDGLLNSPTKQSAHPSFFLHGSWNDSYPANADPAYRRVIATKVRAEIDFILAP